ncbi:FISUMP domain-containing protein [Sphingobacterium paludis]|uniref:Uncharacterized protein (TIGR02145 family) n=1 Tax=Sphingobacterium paludis TaxID=1476465 RepID=A0A4R7D1A7_9SPHI|nr:FISUMP domain-containing protein [Sphingobacterium paludis]TDS13831.1 uncharacterized protein (TIGR02145 family) [Sphingobacterium paludis]
MNTRLLQIATMILVVSSLFSCKTDNDYGQEIVTLNVSLGGEEYDEQDVTFGGQSNTNSRSSNRSNSNISTAVQMQEIPLENGFYISAEVTAEPAIYRPSPAKSSSGGNRAAVVVNPIQRAISFRLAAYNSAGNFVQAKVYTIAANGTVTPADGAAMQLPNGQYTFIAYSYNTNTAPTENLTGTTVSNFTIANAPVANGFMLFNSGLITVSSQATVNLNVILRHLTSPMQVVIDATATNGYLITSVGTTTLGNTRGTATVNLSTGTITNFGGSTAARTMSYPSTAAAAQWASNVAYFSNNTTAGTLSIASLIVGPLERPTPINFSDISILPGFAYTVRLRLNPEDGFETIGGVEAAFIGGRYWMRRNLGSTVANPDVPNATASIGFRDHIGNYYQWGRITPRGNGSTTANQTGTHWNTREESLTAWNLGSETTPVPAKNTTNDPCPTGWRVPTRAEWNLLVASTTQNQSDNVGTTWTASTTNYATAKVFRSLRDRNVVLTFPSGGVFTPTTVNSTVVGVSQFRGSAGYYWTSLSIAPETAALNAARLVTDQTAVTMGQGNNNKNFAFNVRCIRDTQ